MSTILGLAIFYTWIHGMIIGVKKIENLTSYEKFVLVAGVVSAALVVIGLSMN